MNEIVQPTAQRGSDVLYKPGEKPNNIKWLREQSQANPSLNLKFPVMRENTGNSSIPGFRHPEYTPKIYVLLGS